MPAQPSMVSSGPDHVSRSNAGGQGGLANAQLQHLGWQPFRVGQRRGPGEDPAVDHLGLRQVRVVLDVMDRTLQLGPFTVRGVPEAELPVEPDMRPDVVVNRGQTPLGRGAQPIPVAVPAPWAAWAMSPNSPSISPPSQAPDVSGSVLSWTSCQVVSSQRSLASSSSTSAARRPTWRHRCARRVRSSPSAGSRTARPAAWRRRW